MAGSLQVAVRRAKERASFSKKIEVEVSSATEALRAAQSGANIIMLDNFSPQQITKAIALLKKRKVYGKILLEASGGITKENVVVFASTGVDIVSLGEITNSSEALDISLEIAKIKEDYAA
jgi:nicotinate-nucleotide pyrophosphorylase (carboxylating)